jgi:hypothetical protein
VQGTISGLKKDGIKSLKLKSEKIIVDGALEVDGAAYRGPLSITTDEQPTGEKFMGRDVYIKGWEGPLTGAKTNADFTISNFFPNAFCRVLGYGGDLEYTTSGICVIIANWIGVNLYKNGLNLYVLKPMGGIQIDSPNFRIWVKYTHE